MAFEKVEYTFPDEKENKKPDIEIEKSSAIEVDISEKSKPEEKKVESKTDDTASEMEVEVVDDTPEADRGRKVSEPPTEVTEEVTIIGNGTSTIINGENGTAIDVTQDSITIKNLMIIYSEKGIYVNGIEDTIVTSVKFAINEYGVYSEDSQNLIVNNSIFDVDDYGISLSGSSSVQIKDNEFRNGTQTGDYCIYQSESSDNGGANIENNKFNDCNVAWRSGSNSNTFRDNIA